MPSGHNAQHKPWSMGMQTEEESGGEAGTVNSLLAELYFIE